MKLVCSIRYYIEDHYSANDVVPVEYSSKEDLRLDIKQAYNDYKEKLASYNTDNLAYQIVYNKIIQSQEYRTLRDETYTLQNYISNRQRSTPKSQRDDKFFKDLADTKETIALKLEEMQEMCEPANKLHPGFPTSYFNFGSLHISFSDDSFDPEQDIEIWELNEWFDKFSKINK